MSTDVTVALLIYRSKGWLDFVLNSLKSVKNDIDYKILVVANDPTEEIANDTRVNYIHRNDDPNEYYINRVYKAWNKAVEVCDTKYVCLVNSDMAFSDHWLDELMNFANSSTIPTSILVESGRIPSAMPEYVYNFGLVPSEFNHDLWLSHANAIRKPGHTEPGRLFMPVVFERDRFMGIGGFPPGNMNNISGDKILFDRLRDTGMNWITCLGSVVYHTQEGEMRDA